MSNILSETKKPVKKGAYHHGNLREALIAAAADILAEEGIEALSLRKAARRAGVSQAAPYSHFRDKTDLLASVAEIGFQRLALKMVDDAQGVRDPFEKLQAISTSYIDFAARNAPLFLLMYGREFGNMKEHPTLAMSAGKSYSLFANTVNACVKDNPGVDGKAATVAAWGMIHGLASLLVDGKVTPVGIGAKDRGEFARRVTDILATALK